MAKKQQLPQIQEEGPKVEEFMEVGGSPVPGITLRQILRGHKGRIGRIAWSPDGRYLATPQNTAFVLIWEIESNSYIEIKCDSEGDKFVAWSPNGQLLALSEIHGKVSIYSVQNMTKIKEIKTDKMVFCPTWAHDGKTLAAVEENGDLLLWNVDKWELSKKGNDNRLPLGIVWSELNDQLIIHGMQGISILDIVTNVIANKSMSDLSVTYSLVQSPTKSSWAVSKLNTIEIYKYLDSVPQRILEGHTEQIKSLSFSANGNLLASKSEDQTIRIWNTNTWEPICSIEENADNRVYTGLAFHPNKNLLATLGENESAIRLWEIDTNILFGVKPEFESIRYTTAKVVLVGDSGVGKTGLGWRLAHNEFKEHSSTHGQQFWVIPELGLKRKDGTECEAVLWDLAGQPDYRLVHSLYLDDVDLAMVVFDPTNRQEPLSGVDYWLNQLKRKDKDLCNTVLVGARTDRGTSTLTEAEIQAFCKRNGICGGYIPTSAASGEGLSQLMETLKAQIPWDEMTATVTTLTFKRIKEFVLALKEKPKRKNVLVLPIELRELLEATDSKWQFSDAEMMTAIGHLENHGYVKVLHGSDGIHSILLVPDLLVNLASSFVLEARRSPRGLGVLEEGRLLRGEYEFPELRKINKIERKILLDAATVLFLEHNLCFRETFNEQTFLVFPSLINEKRPVDESIKTIEGATYRVKGAVENLYASLVVLLGYTNTFIRTNQWQNQAQYEMGKDEICGFQQASQGDGSTELVLYYGEKTPEPVRLTFRGLFERFLSRRELEIARYQPVICGKCGASLARNVVMDQLNKGKDFSFCHECGEKLSLPSPEPLTRLSRKEEAILDAQQIIAQRRTAFEAALVRVKSLLRDKGEPAERPTCFISYAWGVPEHERWVLQLAKDLRNADVDVLLDRWHSPPGSNLDLYIDRILSSDFVIPVGTPELRQKYETNKADPVVAAELKLINLRVRQPTQYGETVLPVLLTGDAKTSLSPQLQPLVNVDFRDTEYYFRKLFDMIWRLYNLPFDNPMLEELQASMTPQERA